jgi:hypothetical protein
MAELEGRWESMCDFETRSQVENEIKKDMVCQIQRKKMNVWEEMNEFCSSRCFVESNNNKMESKDLVRNEPTLHPFLEISNSDFTKENEMEKFSLLYSASLDDPFMPFYAVDNPSSGGLMQVEPDTLSVFSSPVSNYIMAHTQASCLSFNEPSSLVFPFRMRMNEEPEMKNVNIFGEDF